LAKDFEFEDEEEFLEDEEEFESSDEQASVHDSRSRAFSRGGDVVHAAEQRFPRRRKVCAFCVDKVGRIEYRDVNLLSRYITEQGKIVARRKSGVCARHQRGLAVAIKRARYLALLPYTSEHAQSS